MIGMQRCREILRLFGRVDGRLISLLLLTITMHKSPRKYSTPACTVCSRTCNARAAPPTSPVTPSPRRPVFAVKAPDTNAAKVTVAKRKKHLCDDDDERNAKGGLAGRWQTGFPKVDIWLLSGAPVGASPREPRTPSLRSHRATWYALCSVTLPGRFLSFRASSKLVNSARRHQDRVTAPPDSSDSSCGIKVQNLSETQTLYDDDDDAHFFPP
ncbi:hypothetical protein K438DRAFT_1764919 [Mycena galopus ATCC 62051]|nr:hypothetical protein K438DRAFT_1764919 [Mycena galopus ATCC 62051]